MIWRNRRSHGCDVHTNARSQHDVKIRRESQENRRRSTYRNVNHVNRPRLRVIVHIREVTEPEPVRHQSVVTWPQECTITAAAVPYKLAHEDCCNTLLVTV